MYGGHLIATIFNGDGNLANLVPMNADLNRKAWKMEKNRAEFLDKKIYSVKVEIDIFYDEKEFSLRPESFSITTTIFDLSTGKVLLEYPTAFKNYDNQKYKKKTEEDFEI